MRHVPFILLCLAICAGMCSCNKNRLANAFTESNELRLQIGSNVQFRYTALDCQMSFNSSTLEFMAFNDSMADYYSIKLSEIPVSVGQAVYGNLVWTTRTDVLSRNNVAFETTRIEGDRIWLWSNSARIGVSLQIL